MKYQKVLIKISGEVLGGQAGSGFDEPSLREVCSVLKEAHATGSQISVVCGAGNIMRGAGAGYLGRSRADNAGMLGTAVNILVLEGLLLEMGVPALACGAFNIEGILPKLSPSQMEEKGKGHLLLFAGGTGCPYFSTDTAGVLKALETSSQLMIKATKVDGVYSADPKKDPSAKLYQRISYAEVLNKKLGVMDLTAVSLAMENKLPLRVTDIFRKGAVKAIIEGKDIGTLVC